MSRIATRIALIVVAFRIQSMLPEPGVASTGSDRPWIGREEEAQQGDERDPEPDGGAETLAAKRVE